MKPPLFALLSMWLVVAVGCGEGQPTALSMVSHLRPSCQLADSWLVPLSYGERPSSVASLQVLFGLTAITGERFPDRESLGTDLVRRVPCQLVPRNMQPFLQKLAKQADVGAVLKIMKQDFYGNGLYRHLRHVQHRNLVIDQNRAMFMRRLGLLNSAYGHLGSDAGSRLAHWQWPAGWQIQIKSPSQVKGVVRVLGRSPAYRVPALSVALTVQAAVYPPSHDKAQQLPVIETELIVQRDRDAETWDFYAYDATGRAADEGRFLSSRGELTEAAIPHVCMGCHLDRETGKFGPKPASYAGSSILRYRVNARQF